MVCGTGLDLGGVESVVLDLYHLLLFCLDPGEVRSQSQDLHDRGSSEGENGKESGRGLESRGGGFRWD